MNTHSWLLALLALSPAALAGDVDAEAREDEARAAKAQAAEAPEPAADTPPPMEGAALGPVSVQLSEGRYVSFGARATLWSLPEGQALAVSETRAAGSSWDHSTWRPAPRFGVAYAPEDGEVVEVDLETLAVLRRWPMALPGDTPTHIDVSPNGRFVLAVVPGAELRVWERESGAVVGSLPLRERARETGLAWVLDDGEGQPLVPFLEDSHPRLWRPGGDPGLEAWDSFRYQAPVAPQPMVVEAAEDGIYVKGSPDICAYWLPREGAPQAIEATPCFWSVVQPVPPLHLRYDEGKGSAVIEHLRPQDTWRGDPLWALYYEQPPLMSLDAEGFTLVYLTRPEGKAYVKDLLRQRGQGRRLWGRFAQLLPLEHGTLLVRRSGALAWVPHGAKRPVSIEGPELPPEQALVGSDPGEGRFIFLVGEGGAQSYLVDLEAQELRPLP